MADTEAKRKRPLSPHLQVYRLPIVALTSISHRASGVALAVGTVLLVWWLVAAAQGAESFAGLQSFLASPIGLFVLFGWSLALFYHMCNGIRHLVWDTGHLLELGAARQASFIVVASAIVLTVLVWGVALFLKYPF